MPQAPSLKPRDGQASDRIDALLNEARIFPPSAGGASTRASPIPTSTRAPRRIPSFWAAFAAELEWITPWTTALDWQPPHAKWFVGGTAQRQRQLPRPPRPHARAATRPRFIWEGEPGDRRTLTYFDLHREVCQFANVLKSLGVKKGDRVALYLPLIPELAIAMLACARIGAVHSVVFGGFSAESLRDRINDCAVHGARHRRRRLSARQHRAAQADGRRGARGHAVDPARRRRAARARRRRFRSTMQDGRDHWYHELMQRRVAPTARRSRWTPRTCSTSSTRPARPENRRASCTRPAATSSARTRRREWVFDLRDDDVYWCTADIGWVTGHSYVVYGPLAERRDGA